MGDFVEAADVLLRAGIPVIEVPGWKTRRRPGLPATLDPQVFVGHHTAGASTGEIPSLNVLINGRSDLTGPLCESGIGRSGTWYMVAAGPSNNAGPGGWAGFSTNAKTFGVEVENDGYQEFPAVQMDSWIRGTAALMKARGLSSDRWCRHHEWASYKPDPHGIDGNWFRAQLDKVWAGVPTPTLPQVQEEDMKMFLFRVDNDPTIWITDLLTKRHVKNEAELTDIVYLNDVNGGKLLWPPESGTAVAPAGPYSKVRKLKDGNLLAGMKDVTV